MATEETLSPTHADEKAVESDHEQSDPAGVHSMFCSQDTVNRHRHLPRSEPNERRRTEMETRAKQKQKEDKITLKHVSL